MQSKEMLDAVEEEQKGTAGQQTSEVHQHDNKCAEAARLNNQAQNLPHPSDLRDCCLYSFLRTASTQLPIKRREVSRREVSESKAARSDCKTKFLR